MNKIKSVEQLKKESKGGADFFIALNYGLRSSKNILFNGKEFEIFNEIDGTSQLLTEKQLFTKSNIGKAIEKGAFFKD
jgi:hypothetical protein